MDAKTTCESILKQLKDSNLNFVLQETPFSAFITIRKSLIKNFSSVPNSVSDSVETLKNKIEALVIENSCLKKDLTEMNKRDTKTMKLEQKLKSTRDQIHHEIEGYKKVQNFLVEKEKKIVELKEIINSLNDENVTVGNKLQNISKSVKINEKEASKAKFKSENESTVEKLKIEKCSLLNSLKKLEKSLKKKNEKHGNSKVKGVKDLNIIETNNLNTVDMDQISEAKDLFEEPIATATCTSLKWK